MADSKKCKYSKITFSILVISILLLLISNLFLYRKSKELEKNADYISNISRAITIAAHENSYEFLAPKLLPEDFTHLIDSFEEIKPKIGKQYNIKNYIAIAYKNNNTLMIKITQDKKGNFLIQDMFLLDKNIYDKLKHDTNYR